ncbi:MAG: hypothetical protein V4490_00930 [Pseudomonadota bacterium]
MHEEESSSLQLSVRGLYTLFLTRQGALTRGQFLAGFVTLLGCSCVAVGTAWILSTALHALHLKVLVDFLFSVLVVLFFYSASMLVIKRFNDLHVPAYYALIGLVPVFGTIPLCCSLLLAPGRSTKSQ